MSDGSFEFDEPICDLGLPSSTLPGSIAPPPEAPSYILAEDGSFILAEDGSKILTEASA